MCHLARLTFPDRSQPVPKCIPVLVLNGLSSNNTTMQCSAGPHTVLCQLSAYQCSKVWQNRCV